MKKLLLLAALALPLCAQFGNGNASTPQGGVGGGSGDIEGVTAGCGLSGGGASGSVTLAAARVINAQTGTTYTVLSGDCGKLVTHSNGSAIAVTLPQAGGSFASGWATVVMNLGAGAVTITPTTSTINGAATLVLKTNQYAQIVSDGTNYSAAMMGNANQLDGVTPTTAGKALLDDADAAAQRTTLSLGNVPNYPAASQAEAEAGTANDRIMTPLRVAEAIAALATGSGTVQTGEALCLGYYAAANTTIGPAKDGGGQCRIEFDPVGQTLDFLDDMGVLIGEISLTNFTISSLSADPTFDVFKDQSSTPTAPGDAGKTGLYTIGGQLATRANGGSENRYAFGNSSGQALLGVPGAYDATAWNGDDAPATKNDVRDKIEAGVPLATALAANGANCDSGQSPLGVDAQGAVEGCFTPGASDAVANYVDVTLSQADITGLNATAKTLITAKGANTVIWPRGYVLFNDYNGSVAYGGTPNITLIYNAIGGTPITSSSTAGTSFVQATADAVHMTNVTSAGTVVNPVNVVNNAVVLGASGAITCASTCGSWKIRIWYSVADFN